MLESVYVGNNNLLAYDRNLDLKFYLDALDMRITPDLLFKSHEPSWTRLFVDTLRHGDTVLDVGANFGYYALIAARKGCKKVIAFEPNPRSADLLRMSVEANRFADIVLIYKIAVGAKSENEEVLFWSDAEFSVGSHVKGEGVDHPKRNKGEYIKVKRSSIDDVIGDDLSVNLIKVDVEGSEDAVWNGMTRTINNNPNIKILMELHKTSASSILLNKIAQRGFFISTHTDDQYGNQALLCEFKQR